MFAWSCFFTSPFGWGTDFLATLSCPGQLLLQVQRHGIRRHWPGILHVCTTVGGEEAIPGKDVVHVT